MTEIKKTETQDTSPEGSGLDDDDEGDDSWREEGGSIRRLLVWGGIAVGTLVALAVIFTVGLLVGRTSADPGPATVDSIKSENSVLDNVESLKDSQVIALSEQYSDLAEKMDKDELSAKDRASIIPKAAIKNLDPFIGAFYDMPGDADETTRAQVVQELDEKSSQGSAGAVAESATKDSNSLGQRTVDGDSPSKQLGAEGKKAGEPTMFLMDQASDGSQVVAGLVPFATNSRSVETVFVAKITESGQISDFQYVGTVNGDASALDKARSSMVKGEDGKE